MRIVFCGTPDIAVPSLLALIDAPFTDSIPLVLTQPDRPAGRGRRLRPGPVKAAAEERGLKVLTPERPRDVRALLEEIAPDAIAVVAYGHIFRKWLLELPPHGCINVHFSLLPRHRGVAPVQWSILEGDREAGVSVMRMDRGVDTGPVFRRRGTPIGPSETAGELLQRLAGIGAEELARTMEALAAGTAAAEPQPEEGATYARRLEKDDGRIDWTRTAAEIDRQVRGLSPWPGAFTGWRGGRLKIHAVSIDETGGTPAPGRLELTEAGVRCGTGDVPLRLERVQPEGKGAMEGDAWARGARPDPDEGFDAG